jgi:hypothetical protein
MGYTTDFSGEFTLDKPLTAEHKAYLLAFNQTRRMKRDPAKLGPDPIRKAAKLPAGVDGEYYVGSTAEYGQHSTSDILDYNGPPASQPGLWCQWTPTGDGTAIIWDEGEKFYDYVEWAEYLLEHFLTPWGYRVNGAVEWFGEDRGDIGRILIVNNAVTVQPGEN